MLLRFASPARLNSSILPHSKIFGPSLRKAMSTAPSDSPGPNAIAIYDIHVQPNDLASNIAFNAESDPFPRVLATSRLIAFMEIAAARLLQPCLKPHQLSVGTRIDISHSAPTPVGSKVIAEAKFIGKEKKMFLFEVTARDESGEIGRGTHERAIVDVARLEEAASKRSGLN